MVLLVGPWAIKVPRIRAFGYGCVNNRNEAKWCRKRGACPVLWCAPYGLVSVMQRARPLTSQEWAIIRQHPSAFHDPSLRVEAKPDSFGIIGSRIVVVDYGW